MKKLTILVAAAVLLAATPRARADEWYGWQIMIADAVSTGVFVAGLGTGGREGDYIMGLGAAGFALAGPAIHVAHGDYAAGGVDLGLRVGLPIGGAYVGAALDRGDFEFSGLVGAAYGFAIGSLSAMVIDYALLSTSKHPEERHEWATVAPTKGGAVLGLGGRF